MGPIGILALQGAVEPHAKALAELGLQGVPVRDAAELDRVAGLILPGGESSTMLRLMERFDLAGPLDRFVRGGRPVLATCAGLILAARRVVCPEQPGFGWLDLAVARNAWGRQIESFEAWDDTGRRRLVFIRAPRILEAGPDVEVLASLRGEPVLVRQLNVLGATFHPELTSDRSVHRHLLGSDAIEPASGPVAAA
jgi:5'-phosphate synthase pdxT subunit